MQSWHWPQSLSLWHPPDVLTQRLWLQAWPEGQTTPQAPQLAESAEVSEHTPPQSVWPAAHTPPPSSVQLDCSHTPDTQSWHWPQSESVWQGPGPPSIAELTHAPAEQISPVGQSLFDWQGAGPPSVSCVHPPKFVKPEVWNVATVAESEIGVILLVVPSDSTASMKSSARLEPAGRATGIWIVTGLVNVVPLGPKLRTGPAVLAPLGATGWADWETVMTTACESAPAGTVMVVPAMEGSSALLTVIDPPCGPIWELFTKALATSIRPEVQAQNAAAPTTATKRRAGIRCMVHSSGISDSAGEAECFPAVRV